MSKSFLTIKQAYTKLGLSGGGQSFIRKSELVATGKCDTTKLTKYGNNDYVVDDDIVKSISVTYPRPIFIIDIQKDHNNTSKLYDEISGLTLTSPNTKGKAIVTRNGKRTLQFTSGGRSVYEASLSNFPSVYNAIKSGNATFIVIMEFTSDVLINTSLKRWGMWAFWSNSQIFGWFYPHSGTAHNGSVIDKDNLTFNGFKGTNLGNGFGFIVLSMSKSKRKILRTKINDFFNAYREGLYLASKNYVGFDNVNDFGSLTFNSTFQIGKALESSYYASLSPNNYYLQFAIFDEGLTEEQIKQIFDDNIIKY